ncbi:hypothetical protein EmuJ_001113300 [Echinococcus multilocularis]|uniref:Uncharacterized protein n=1 Tax=Echinococcus multilocularis TaxID=6211 RepID=A0A068YF09_ECHMU|nr:hypothetical protein EmuJ_001113300 [Echinococcus multilocularis]
MGTNSITMAQDMLTNAVHRLMIPVVLLNAIILSHCVSFSFCITFSFSVPITPIDKAKENGIFGRLKSFLFSYLRTLTDSVSDGSLFDQTHQESIERAVVASASQG